MKTKTKHPLLGLDWMRKQGITLESDQIATNINHVNMPEITIERNIATPKRKVIKLFSEKEIVKNIEMDIPLKEGAKSIQQKGRPIPINLQPAAEKVIEKLKKQGHIENAKKT